jgi:hypothetical protein
MCLCNKYYNYIRLFYHLYKYYNYLIENNYENDENRIDNIINLIKDCGCVMIKFTQWLLPRIEAIYFNNKEKPLWFLKLENFYENCNNNDITYVKNKYKEMFNEDFDNKYELIDTIGSGSIGEAFLIETRPIKPYIKKQMFVMKVKHPRIEDDIKSFDNFINFIFKIPYVKNKFISYLPIDYKYFIKQFKEQTNFVHEGNNLSEFYNHYCDNEYILIPKLINSSSDIIIMEYISGENISNIEINDYQKYKLLSIFFSFIKNNQHIVNFNHGDLHIGNWKINKNNDNYKIVIYDFGYCFHCPYEFTNNIDILTETFSYDKDDNNDDNDLNKNDLFRLTKSLVINPNDNNFDININNYINDNFDDLYKCKNNPTLLLGFISKFCINNNYLLHPISLQCVIVWIQIYGKLTDIDIVEGENNCKRSFNSIIELLSLNESLDIFNDLNYYYKNLLNHKKYKNEELFQINLDENLESELLKLINN